MKRLYLLTLAAFFALSTSIVMADPVDSGPPAQQQKNAVPDSTNTGNYLEPQPDENGANATQAPDKKAKKNAKKNAKPANIEKGKSHTESPDSGGVEVK